jgi:hypothetical protein
MSTVTYPFDHYSFHPTLTELPALFGMPNQGFNASSATGKASVHLRLTLRQTPNI